MRLRQLLCGSLLQQLVDGGDDGGITLQMPTVHCLEDAL